jgi:glucosamine-6-phosphate deaminase
VLSPEPADAFVGMGGTLSRLREQGHEVRLVFLTSGNLRVSDGAALNFARVVLEMAESSRSPEWESQTAYARSIVEAIDAKGEFGIDPDFVRKLKGLILRGEARDAASACRLRYHDSQFLDLPFYETGRYRRFRYEEADARAVETVLAEFQPHSIFATGDASDPSSPQAIAFRAFASAWESLAGAAFRKDCRVWLYRGRDRAFEAHEIDMAVPMSPDQLEEKTESIRRFMSINEDDLTAPAKNREMAATYDALGMAEYEGIEAFRRWSQA